MVPIRPVLRFHLEWWLDQSNLLKGKSILYSHTDLSLYTDASQEGWGAHLDSQMTAGVWNPQDSSHHINWLELKAVFLALQDFEMLVTGHSVLVHSDNTTVVAYINKLGGTRSPTLCYLLWELMLWCIDRKILLSARHVPGKLNGIADALSRRKRVLPTEWAIPVKIAHLLFLHWGEPTVDLFATFMNRKLPLFVSPIPDPRAMATDALSMSWKGLSAYAFPPFALLPIVLRKIQEESSSVILVAPLWPNRSWFPVLLSLLVDFPVVLPDQENLLSQGRGIVHPNPSLFHLHAFRLSNDPSVRRDFLNKLPQSLPDHKETAPSIPMEKSGKDSLIGVVEGRRILSIHLPRQ
ncbi:uncharacterized protein LOC144445368 [Glandiceps talaboti]